MKIIRPKSKQPIPKHAKKVFQGKIFRVYQWPQTMFDGSQTTFEKIKRVDTVDILPITKDKKIILSKQEQPGLEPFIGCIGGRIDPGEDPEQAAQRELLEETGYKSENLVLWDSQQFHEKIDWAIYTFLAKNCEWVQEQNIDNGERIELMLVSFDEFIDIACSEKFRDSEIALKVLRIMRDKAKLEEMRKLFLC